MSDVLEGPDHIERAAYKRLERELALATRELEDSIRIRQELERELADYKEANDDKLRLVREIDVAMHGTTSAAPQASLCDLVPLAARLRLRAEVAEAQAAAMREALGSIRQYGGDTLSGRVGGPDDRKWQRMDDDGVFEMVNLATAALSALDGGNP